MAVDTFRYPFIRSNNYLGAYRLPQGKASLPVLESMEFEVVASGSPANFAGNATIAFDQSGILQAGAGLSGTTNIAIGQTGALSAGAALVGTATVTFDQTGTFSAASAIGGGANFDGTATITFGQSGNLSAGSSLSATNGITFSQTGTLRAGSALAGAATVTFGQIGNLSTGGESVPAVGGGAYPVNRRYYRRHDVYEVEADLENIIQSTKRKPSRNGRKNVASRVYKSVGELLSKVDEQSPVPIAVRDLQQAYDLADRIKTNQVNFTEWKQSVMAAANQALLEIQMQIELMEEEDNEMLLLIA